MNLYGGCSTQRAWLSRYLRLPPATTVFSRLIGHAPLQLRDLTQGAAVSGPFQKRVLAGVTAVVLSSAVKGGVGKSTVAVGLASALQQGLGLRCGILDADIYGPSVLHLLRASVTQASRDRNPKTSRPLVPLVTESGLKVFGLAALQKRATEALVWRGPVATRAVQQLLFDVDWAPLDILVVDTPPGTGDVLLTLAQQLKVQGAILVTTPPQLVEVQVRRGLEALARLSIPVLGIVENMAYVECSRCQHKEEVFGAPEQRAAALAQAASVQVLAHLPLNKTLCEAADQGRMAQDTAVQTMFSDLAVQVATLLGFPV
ncbi:similar to multidrug resistance protein [Cyanidioschyzon merolae strain 10D]|uniref:Similar to multidrug resistance protein n=1 Tax=Cyanidioschyzon merolae (strain NIES-3377 / 10D) TaxID=280699 RepID=M1VDI7_CYAM1|nr:similar to multidrug resistance protein [Cyanidioschyzon merolae strain 10D]BAM80822.1 similar to multidrug resistance protein [Cyanidioschyzon merolae strain 10D]|eukprot:XP_005536858.1 similar to multidrug resistance protein [Cyanidioschyzon merolae strain 10D]